MVIFTLLQGNFCLHQQQANDALIDSLEVYQIPFSCSLDSVHVIWEGFMDNFLTFSFFFFTLCPSP